jgi:hypothetical protein
MRPVSLESAKTPGMDREYRLASESALQGQDGATEYVNFRAGRAVSGTSAGGGW